MPRSAKRKEALKGSPDDGAKTVWHSGKAMRLCKAAPDLLEAAKNCLDTYEIFWATKTDEAQLNHESSWQRLREVIAKPESSDAGEGRDA